MIPTNHAFPVMLMKLKLQEVIHYSLDLLFILSVCCNLSVGNNERFQILIYFPDDHITVYIRIRRSDLYVFFTVDRNCLPPVLTEEYDHSGGFYHGGAVVH